MSCDCALGHVLMIAKASVECILFFSDIVLTGLWISEMRENGNENVYVLSGCFLIQTFIACAFCLHGTYLFVAGKRDVWVVFPWFLDMYKHYVKLTSSYNIRESLEKKITYATTGLFLAFDEVPQLIIIAVYTSYLPKDPRKGNDLPEKGEEGYKLFSLTWALKYVGNLVLLAYTILGLALYYMKTDAGWKKNDTCTKIAIIFAFLFASAIPLFFIIIPIIGYQVICIDEEWGAAAKEAYCA